jgi:hypothetical protein
VRTATLLALVVLAGCATARTTPEQDLARAAWDACPKAANLALDRIDPNGQIHYRAVSNLSGARELEECLRDYFATHPVPPKPAKPAR